MGKTKYQLQGLLERTEEGVRGPMGPVNCMEEAAQQIGFKFSGLARLINDQAESGYDHLIAKANYTDGTSRYFFIVDMGHAFCPTFYVDTEGEVAVTPIYKKEIERMDYHRANVELPKRSKENPIMILDEKQVLSIIAEAEVKQVFKVKEHEEG